jgi:hypothetical protein
MANTYDRYSMFREDGEVKIVPFGKIEKKSSDLFEVYKKNSTRLDLVSYKYYGNPNYAWLIMQANPEFGSMEYEIPDGSVLRIPYPLDASIRSYEESIKKYNELY